MSVIKFNLKEEHIKLLKHLRWSKNKNNLIINVSDDEESLPFDEYNIYEAIDLILNGRPEGFNPFEESEPIEYTSEQKEYFDSLYNELPTALDIILYNQNFELGQYKTKYNCREWKKIK